VLAFPQLKLLRRDQCRMLHEISLEPSTPLTPLKTATEKLLAIPGYALPVVHSPAPTMGGTERAHR